MSAFRTRVEDEIAWDPSRNQNVSAGTTRRQGMDVSLVLRPRRGVSLTLARGIVDATLRGGFPGGAGYVKGARLPLVARSSTLVAASLGPWRGVSADLSARRLGSAALDGDFDASEPSLPTRTRVDMAVRVAPDRWRGLTVELLAENLLDDRTPSRAIESWGQTYYTPPRPRAISLGLAWRFPSEN